MSIRERDLAVQVIDGIHGYTAEFAPSPEWHREMYDRAEGIIARAFNDRGAVALRAAGEAVIDAWDAMDGTEATRGALMGAFGALRLALGGQ